MGILDGIKGIIFDMDGVLLDSGNFHRQAWIKYAGELGFDFSEQIFLDTFGKTNFQILPMLFKKDLPHDELLRMSEAKEACFREIAAGKISLFTGLDNLLSRIKAKGYKIALGTSTPRSNVDFFYHELHLEKFMDIYSCSDDVRNGKPAPDIFLKAAEKLKLMPNNCLVIEDSFAGFEAANNAKMKCVAVASTNSLDILKEKSGVDHIIKETQNLLDLFH